MFTVGRIVVILDAIVASARDLLGNHCPLITKSFAQTKDFDLFIATDRSLVNIRVQMIVPSKKGDSLMVHVELIFAEYVDHICWK